MMPCYIDYKRKHRTRGLAASALANLLVLAACTEPPSWQNVDAIARFCQRGPQDCNYATDQMQLSLQKP